MRRYSRFSVGVVLVLATTLLMSGCLGISRPIDVPPTAVEGIVTYEDDSSAIAGAEVRQHARRRYREGT